MRQFKWIEWNLQKVAAHGLSPEDVEAAFNVVHSLQERRDGSFQMYAETPSGRRIWVIGGSIGKMMRFQMSSASWAILLRS
jgi:hypothetical protein